MVNNIFTVVNNIATKLTSVDTKIDGIATNVNDIKTQLGEADGETNSGEATQILGYYKLYNYYLKDVPTEGAYQMEVPGAHIVADGPVLITLTIRVDALLDAERLWIYSLDDGGNRNIIAYFNVDSIASGNLFTTVTFPGYGMTIDTQGMTEASIARILTEQAIVQGAPGTALTVLNP